MQIYLNQNEQQVGPFTVEEIQKMLVSGSVARTDYGWHEGLAEWQHLSDILPSGAARPITAPPLPPARPLTFSCPTCGSPKSNASDPCPVCANARALAASLSQPQPIQITPKKVNKGGAWCPHCGNRNSYRKSEGVGCLTLGILFISLIGILFIPFLGKTWHCRECGHAWK